MPDAWIRDMEGLLQKILHKEFEPKELTSSLNVIKQTSKIPAQIALCPLIMVQIAISSKL